MIPTMLTGSRRCPTDLLRTSSGCGGAPTLGRRSDGTSLLSRHSFRTTSAPVASGSLVDRLFQEASTPLSRQRSTYQKAVDHDHQRRSIICVLAR